MSNSTNHSMEALLSMEGLLSTEARLEVYTLAMVEVTEVHIMDITITTTIMDIILDTVRDRGVEAVGLIPMVAIRSTSVDF